MYDVTKSPGGSWMMAKESMEIAQTVKIASMTRRPM